MSPNVDPLAKIPSTACTTDGEEVEYHPAAGDLMPVVTTHPKSHTLLLVPASRRIEVAGAVCHQASFGDRYP